MNRSDEQALGSGLNDGLGGTNIINRTMKRIRELEKVIGTIEMPYSTAMSVSMLFQEVRSELLGERSEIKKRARVLPEVDA